MISPCQIHKIKQGNDTDRIYMIVSASPEDFEEIKTDTPMIKGELRIDDNRRISAEQRKKAYATIKDIAEFTGHNPEFLKEYLKYDFISETGCDYFSLSDCDMTTARHYISHVLFFALRENIPLSDIGLNRTDDIGRWLYHCLKTKKCCICGKANSDIHHEKAIGRGFDRKSYDDSKHEKICLCREHHSEGHNIGVDEFRAKYHVYGIIFTEETDGN